MFRVCESSHTNGQETIDWKPIFQEGISRYRSGKVEDAIALFSRVISLGVNEVVLYDSRAAAYEKVGRVKEGLRDAKKVIDLAPNRWQGYFRSARLFDTMDKHSHALQMVELALERVPTTDLKRRTELNSLRETIAQHQNHCQLTERCYHLGKLPIEIATAIFALALADDHAAVVGLAQVCKAWRTAILGTSSLWTTLVLSGRDPERKAKAWKLRSRGRISELCLRAGLTRKPWALDELNDVVFDNLQTLRIHHFPMSEVRAKLPLLTSSVLRSLDVLEVDNCVETRHVSWLWSEPEMQLRTLHVESSTFDWAAVAGHFKRLETFTFRGPLVYTELSDVIALLRENPNLRKLDLSVMDFPHRRHLDDDEQLVSLPRLTHLEIEPHGFAISLLLPLMSLASLQVLRISKGTHPVDRSLRHLLHAGSLASLVELRIQLCAVSAEIILEVLGAASSLEVLQLQNLGGNQVNRVIEALATRKTEDVTSDAASVSLCPSLKHVNFSHCPDVKGGSLQRLVKARLRSTTADTVPECTIDSLIIDNCPSVDATILPWLRDRVRVISCTYLNKKQSSWRR